MVKENNLDPQMETFDISSPGDEKKEGGPVDRVNILSLTLY
jgi:hypothetical protein